MKQEEIDILMSKIDKKCRFPKNWDKFIEKNANGHRLIIKDKETNELYCTHCNQTFIDTSVKVRDYIKCPHCREISKVYGLDYYNKHFENSVVLVQKLNNQIIIRVFEIYSYFEKNDKRIHRHLIEYARILPKIGKFIGNNVDISMYGTMCVFHGNEKIKWYKYNGYKCFTDYPTYPYNKKKLEKGTNLEYAPIKEFMDKFSFYGLTYLDVIQLAIYESFELLWKLKLYKLCFHAKSLNKKGNFQKRFGVPKSFLKFMQDNNISYKELLLLQLFQKTDKQILNKYEYTNINYLRFLVNGQILDIFEQSGISLDRNNIKVLKEIKKFIPLRKLKNYPKGLSNLFIYRDYLKMSNELALNYKSKKDLFPRNLIDRHDKLQTQVKVAEDMKTQFAVYLRYLDLSKYTFEDDKYIIFPAPSLDDLKDEGRQQGNCVYSLYSTKYMNGKTEIYFIRNKKNINQSFITLEFNNGKVVQKELPNHSKEFTKEHNNFIDKWVNFRQFMNQREKYNKRIKIETVRYDLKSNVA